MLHRLLCFFYSYVYHPAVRQLVYLFYASKWNSSFANLPPKIWNPYTPLLIWLALSSQV